MAEGDLIHGTLHFSIKFKFHGVFVINDYFTGQRCYSIRNSLSKCILHHILDLAAFPDAIGDCSNQEIIERLVSQMRTSDCECQKVSTSFLHEKFVPAKDMHNEAKGVSCRIKFRDGTLHFEGSLFFRAASV